MPTSLPVPDKSAGDVFTETMWDSYIRDNINKLLNLGHRVLTVAQFAALTSPEGTKGTVAPDEVYLEVDATSGVLWHLGYESGESTSKWRFLGGPAMFSEVVTSEGGTGAGYFALATAGPSVTLPRSGDYDVLIGFHCDGVVGGVDHRMSYDIGGTGAVNADWVHQVTSSANPSRLRRKAALGAVALVAKYSSGGASQATFGDRFMSVLPVRVRHDA
ncbi:MAG TPA: hypothetical protein VJK66_02530 [Gaiellaceae bacterium]|nr:hypothetical protein [Gaiellaceae bacterium]